MHKRASRPASITLNKGASGGSNSLIKEIRVYKEMRKTNAGKAGSSIYGSTKGFGFRGDATQNRFLSVPCFTQMAAMQKIKGKKLASPLRIQKIQGDNNDDIPQQMTDECIGRPRRMKAHKNQGKNNHSNVGEYNFSMSSQIKPEERHAFVLRDPKDALTAEVELEEVDLVEKSVGCVDTIKIPQIGSDFTRKQTKAYIKNICNYTKLQNKGQQQLQMKQYRLMEQSFQQSQRSSRVVERERSSPKSRLASRESQDDEEAMSPSRQFQ